MNCYRTLYKSLIIPFAFAVSLAPITAWSQVRDKIDQIPDREKFDIVIDLSTDSSGAMLSPKRGELSVLVVNLLPNRYIDYRLKSEYTYHVFKGLVPADAPNTTAAAAVLSSECTGFQTTYTNLQGAATSVAVDKALQDLYAAYSLIKDADESCDDTIHHANNLIRQSYKISDLTVNNNINSKLSVILGGGTPILTLEVEPIRTQWISTYGLGFTDNRDDKYHSKGNATDGYVVAKQNDEQMLSYSAMLMFTYPIGDIGNGGMEWGFSAGLGASQSSVSGFAGLGLVFGKNFVLSGGVTVQEFEVLAGPYEEGQSLGNATVDSSTLNTKTFKPAASIILSYKFAAGGTGE